MAEKRNTLPFGSISTGTHREKDLLSAFIGALDEVAPEEALSIRMSYPRLFPQDPGAVIIFTREESDADDIVLEFLAELLSDDASFSVANTQKVTSVFLTEGWNGPEDDSEIWKSNEVSVLLNETIHALLDEHAPEFAYFGTHPGDGADFGVWVAHEALDDAERDGTLLKVSDLSDAKNTLDMMQEEDRRLVEYVVVTNDHGNMTLYRHQGRRYEMAEPEFEEIWSVV